MDNFETVVNSLNPDDLKNAIELLKFSTNYANIAITSREKLSPGEDFEDVYSLTPLITDDALALFQKYYSQTLNDNEIRILRTEILEDLLNNNPLAIKLVTKSRTSFKHISELKAQLEEHFFESINEDYSLAFKNNADLNIERSKSIYQSINYSYTTLNSREKLAFELLNLFPDGISLINFKRCFEKKPSLNNISDKELRVLRDKSLLEDYEGTLQLQPLIRRFAEYQFSKKSDEIKEKYCSDAYSFNAYILKIIQLIVKKRSTSEALKIYSFYKNNLLNVLSYIPFIEINESGPVREKKFLVNYIDMLDFFIVNEKQIHEFFDKIDHLQDYFSDLPNATELIKVLGYNKAYYFQEFDYSYKRLTELLSVEQMENRIFENEDYLEFRYKNMIANVHSMEGFTFQRIASFVKNDEIDSYQNADFFYLGIVDNISRKRNSFYFFEYELMFNNLNVAQLEKYIASLYLDEHLEIMQCTYTLSKVKELDKKTIQKLVITNPYTKGLKELMLAFISITNEEKDKHYKKALQYLSHIKYYYLEGLYYYTLFLQENNNPEFKIRHQEGLTLSSEFYYQHLNFLFENIGISNNSNYTFSYAYYPLEFLEDFVKRHNEFWEKYFREHDSQL